MTIDFNLGLSHFEKQKRSAGHCVGMVYLWSWRTADVRDVHVLWSTEVWPSMTVKLVFKLYRSSIVLLLSRSMTTAGTAAHH